MYYILLDNYTYPINELLLTSLWTFKNIQETTVRTLVINVIDQIMNGWWIIKKTYHSLFIMLRWNTTQLMNYYWPLCERSSLNSFRINVLVLSGILARFFSMNIYYCCIKISFILILKVSTYWPMKLLIVQKK
jgi:hypothetical protein